MHLFTQSKLVLQSFVVLVLTAMLSSCGGGGGPTPPPNPNPGGGNPPAQKSAMPGTYIAAIATPQSVFIEAAPGTFVSNANVTVYDVANLAYPYTAQADGGFSVSLPGMFQAGVGSIIEVTQTEPGLAESDPTVLTVMAVGSQNP